MNDIAQKSSVLSNADDAVALLLKSAGYVLTRENAERMIQYVRHAHEPPAGTAQQPLLARPRSEWHEDTGPVLWWHFPIDSPPFSGTPNDSDWPERDDQEYPVEDGYYTHWTPIVIPTGCSGSTNCEGQS